MNNNRKALLLLLCAVLMVGASVFGTLAYLTDTEAVTNTFSVGSVGLSLDEAKVDKMGKPDGNNRWQPTKEDLEQEYYLLPGHSYTKDPTVTVDAGSEDAYVRMMVTITYQEEADAVFAKYGVDNWINIDAANWRVNGNPVTTKDAAAGTVTRTYEFRYKSFVPKSNTATELPALFTTLKVPGGVTTDEMALLDDMTINVVAHAIQKAGFDDADAAWVAFGTQHS